VEPARVRQELERGRVVIVAGFQGATHESVASAETTTLGRGGSDTTAVALAARLAADRCEIFTDVEGIYTADPRVVPQARLLPSIGYEEMLELAGQGAQVMQPRAVELGWVNGVEIAVRSTFSDHPGTLIREERDVEQLNKVRGVAHDRNVAKLTLLAVPEGLTADSDVAKVSIVGAGIRSTPGYAAQMFGALADAGINIEMISMSDIRITCIIAEPQVEAAARALHAAFQLEQPEQPEQPADEPG